MAELRRLLIESHRLLKSQDNNDALELTINEYHYLAHVLRLHVGDKFHIVDGIGNLWCATLDSGQRVKLNSSISKPDANQKKSLPRLCLAVAVPKKGFDDVLRMCCEIGIDILQPITSDRSVINAIHQSRFKRWQYILNEAVEQSERLWKPDLRSTITFSELFIDNSRDSFVSFGVTRSKQSKPLDHLLSELSSQTAELWVVIGPEGGWSEKEIQQASKNRWLQISIGENILRTSTAAISATQIMASWRSQLR